MVSSRKVGSLVPKEMRSGERRPSRARQPDTAGWLTRREAAELFGVVENTIINWQKKKLLSPIRVVKADRGGAERIQLLYDPKQLAAIARPNRFARLVRSEGEIA